MIWYILEYVRKNLYAHLCDQNITLAMNVSVHNISFSASRAMKSKRQPDLCIKQEKKIKWLKVDYEKEINY